MKKNLRTVIVTINPFFNNFFKLHTIHLQLCYKMIKFKHIVKEDIKYYKRVYKKIENKFDMQEEKPEEDTKRLLEYIKLKKINIT